MIPVVTITGTALAGLMGGALLIEQIFSIPGLGTYLFGGIASNDVPVVLGCVIVIAMFHGFLMLLVDLVYTVVDPRLKSSIIAARARKTNNRGVNA